MRIGVIAALPGELKPLVRAGWHRMAVARRSGIRMWQTEINGAEIVAVCAGMGAAAALRAFTAAEHAGSLDMVLSVGWAGALDASLAGGSTHIASAVIDARTGERFALAKTRRDCILVTAPVVAGPKEKQRLALTYQAALVDMEASTIARLAQMRGIPVLCFKAISDELAETGPDLNPYINSDTGRLRTARLVAHTVGRPAWWRPLMRVGAASAKGSNTLAAAVTTFLSGPRDADAVNESGNVDW